ASSSSHLFNVDCHLVAAEDAGASISDPKVLVHLFRIAQEAIRNAVSHGGARVIELRLDGHSDLVTLTISDDGDGIDPQQLESGSATGMGLITMDHRVRMMCGQLHIDNRDGGGLAICCEVPLT
ncbi:MAG: sensor histidine kinase, partial [Verrucomicrobiales bacterium]